MNNKNSVSTSMSLSSIGFIVFVVFLVLKLCNMSNIDYEWLTWFWVFFPLWSSVATELLLAIIIVIFSFLFLE